MDVSFIFCESITFVLIWFLRFYIHICIIHYIIKWLIASLYDFDCRYLKCHYICNAFKFNVGCP